MPDFPKEVPEHILLRSPSDSSHGLFTLHKSFFLIEGVNYPIAGRCDNLTYTGVSPTYGTEFHKESVTIGGRSSSYLISDPTSRSASQWDQFLEVPGKFCFTYIMPVVVEESGNIVYDDSYENGKNPGALWLAKSIIELFKIIREWSLMIDKPFSINHPMAIYSKMVFDVLSPPKSILSEIDSLPDMHLARFLKGDINHRSRVDGFPQMSELMEEWFKGVLSLYPKTTTREKLRQIKIN